MATPKIIPYQVKLRSTTIERSLVRPIVYTNDLRSAEFQFQVTDMQAGELSGATATTLLYMRDGSFFQNPKEDVELTGTTFSYLLKEDEGNHAGIARIQLVVRFNEGLDDEQNFPSQLYDFEIVNGLETQVAQQIMIHDWTTLTREARAYIDEFAANEILREAEFDNNEFDRNAAFNLAQTNRQNQFSDLAEDLTATLAAADANIEEFDVALETGIAAAKLAEKLEDFEEINNSRLLSTERQLAEAVAMQTGLLKFMGDDTTANINAKTGMDVGDYWWSTDGLTYYAYNGTDWSNVGSILKELTDTRITADGVVHATAGTAVRAIHSELESIGLVGKSIYDRSNLYTNKYPDAAATIVDGNITPLLTLTTTNTTKPFDMGSLAKHAFVCLYVSKMYMYNASGGIVGNINGVLIEGTSYRLFQYNTASYQSVAFRFDTVNIDLIEIYKGATLPDVKYRFSGKKILGDVSLSDNTDISKLKTDVSAIQTTLNTNNVNFSMPTNVRFLKDTLAKRRIPYYNVLTGNDKKAYTLSRYGNYRKLDDHFVVEGTESGWTKMIKRSDPLETQLAIKTTYWTAVDPTTKQNPAAQHNVLMIGDSFTDAGTLPALVKRKLTIDHGFTNFNFVGSRTSDKEGMTTKHEGHAGYTVTDFVKLDNTLGKGTGSPNPFLFTGALSITTLLSNSGFSGTVDSVVIELGVNDVLSNWTTDSITTNLTTLINQIRIEYPNSAIYIVGLVFVSNDNDFLNIELHNKKVQDLNKAYEILVGTLTDVYYVDVCMLFDTNYGYPYEMVALYDNAETVKVQTDYLHPYRVGYDMESECIVANMVNNLVNV